MSVKSVMYASIMYLRRAPGQSWITHSTFSFWRHDSLNQNEVFGNICTWLMVWNTVTWTADVRRQKGPRSGSSWRRREKKDCFVMSDILSIVAILNAWECIAVTMVRKRDLSSIDPGNQRRSSSLPQFRMIVLRHLEASFLRHLGFFDSDQPWRWQ